MLRKRDATAFCFVGVFLLNAVVAVGSEPPDPSKDPRRKGKTMDSSVLIQKLAGDWEGSCRTWFKPEVLADESRVSGVFEPVLGGQFLRHRYQGSIKKKERSGEEMIGFNAVTKQFQISWVDDFHMNYAMMFSEGPATEDGFEVFGEYDVAVDQPKWGWKTVYQWVDDDHLTITAYNVTPEGDEAKAVETKYKRVKKTK